jgi:hypothetical protein
MLKWNSLRSGGGIDIRRGQIWLGQSWTTKPRSISIDNAFA